MAELQYALALAGLIALRAYHPPAQGHLHGLVVRILGPLAGYGSLIKVCLPHYEKILPIPGLLPAWGCVGLGLLAAWQLRRPRERRYSFGKLLSRVPRAAWKQGLIVFVVCVLGRLAFFGTNPVPQPMIQDEYANVLAADTFAHGRLTNPTPEFWSHFETYHELLRPTYMSKYPPGQALFLALGQILFNLPFAGVLLSCALMCVALYWALAAMMPRRWAFLGGILAAARIGWYSYWDDSYWGGAVTALAACLLIGSAVRLSRRVTASQAAIFAFSLILLANNRPYEGLLLALPVVIGLGIKIIRTPRRTPLIQPLLCFLLVFASGIGWMAYDNWRVTGNPLDLPYSEHYRQYPGSPPFVFQRLHLPANVAVSGQKNQYFAVGLPDDLKNRTPRGFMENSLSRTMKTWSFFVGPELSLLLLGFLLYWRSRKLRWLWYLLGFLILGWAIEVWMWPHYQAPALPVFAALGVYALRALYTWRRSRGTGAVLVTASLLAMLFSSFLRLFLVPVDIGFAQTYGDFIRSKDAVITALKSIPGKHLILVHYDERHRPHCEWVYNSHDIPSQRIIWAHDLDPEDPNLPLICHYKDRRVWMLQPPDTGAWQADDARKALKAVNVEQACNPLSAKAQ